MTDQQAKAELESIEEKANEGFVPFSGFAGLDIDWNQLMTNVDSLFVDSTITDERGIEDGTIQTCDYRFNGRSLNGKPEFLEGLK